VVVNSGQMGGDVGFWESVSGGVTWGWYSDLKANLGPEKHYKAICTRKLTADRNSVFHLKVNEFINEAEGKGYDLTPAIFNRESVQPD